MKELATKRIFRDLETAPTQGGEMKLNLGSGRSPHLDYVNVDIRNIPGVDAIQDLNAERWDFDDSCAEIIIAEHVVEHLDDRIHFLKECRRILKPEGTLVLEVPNYRHIGAFSNLEHRWYFTRQSFDGDPQRIEGEIFRKVKVKYILSISGHLITIKNEFIGRWMDRLTRFVFAIRFYLRPC